MTLQQQLIDCLQTLSPEYLEVLNESNQHGGYFPDKESHFKLTIVSTAFQGLRLVQRHQKIYALTAPLMGNGKIHALALHTYTPDEWQGTRPDSPQCANAKK